MNYELMREKLRDAKENLDEVRAKAIRLAGNGASEEELDQAEKDMKAAKRRYDLIRGECDEMEKEQQKPKNLKPVETPEEKSLKAMLKTNEYARSFCAAIRMGAKADRSTGYHESLKPVYDALTIAGGDPTGSDGGFLVPEDIDNTIRQVMRESEPLSELFTVENVGTNSGWRVMDNAPTKGFTKIGGELQPVPMDDQPKFQRVNFALDTYGLIIPISRELLQDEVANLMSYLGRWYGEKLVITENTLLTSVLGTLSPTAASADKSLFASLKTLLNKTLKPVHSRRGVILTNQTGLDLLDQELDGTDHPLLQPDVKDATGFRVLGRRLVVVTDETLPNLAGGAPLYAGDMKQLATLFRRMPLEMASTDIGGEAWRNNGVEVRGIVREGTAAFDKTSVAALTLPTA